MWLKNYSLCNDENVQAYILGGGGRVKGGGGGGRVEEIGICLLLKRITCFPPNHVCNLCDREVGTLAEVLLILDAM